MKDRKNHFNKDRLGDFYVDKDENSGLLFVVGTETGFCYSSHMDETEAKREATRLADAAKCQNVLLSTLQGM